MRNIRVLMALAGADRVEGANAKNANNAAEYVGLLKVQIKQFLGSLFDEIDGALQVSDSEAGRQRNRSIESVRSGRHRWFGLFRLSV